MSTSSCTEFVNYCKKIPEMMMTFKCGDQDVKAVKPMMCMRSTVIEAMMKGDCIEAKTNTVKAVDFSPEIVQKMVEFCETGNIGSIKDVETELYEIADFFNNASLKNYLVSKIYTFVNPENCVQWFQLFRNYADEKMIDALVNHVSNNKDYMINKFNSSEAADEDVKEFWEAVDKLKK